MRIATLKLPDGNLGFEHPVTLEAARIYWRTWTPGMVERRSVKRKIRQRWIQAQWKLMDVAARLPIVWRWPYRERWQPRWTDGHPVRYPPTEED